MQTEQNKLRVEKDENCSCCRQWTGRKDDHRKPGEGRTGCHCNCPQRKPLGRAQSAPHRFFNLTRVNLKGFDVVVALGGWTEQSVHAVERGEKYLADLLEGTPTGLVVAGGVGSPYTDPEHTQIAADAPDFPDVFKPVAAAPADRKSRQDLNWTYVSWAADFQVDGARTGRVSEANDNFTLNDKGQRVISYADYADAFGKEVLSGTHNRQQISFLQA